MTPLEQLRAAASAFRHQVERLEGLVPGEAEPLRERAASARTAIERLEAAFLAYNEQTAAMPADRAAQVTAEAVAPEVLTSVTASLAVQAGWLRAEIDAALARRQQA